MRASSGGLATCVSVRVGCVVSLLVVQCVSLSRYSRVATHPVPLPPCLSAFLRASACIMEQVPVAVVQDFSGCGAVEPPRPDKEQDAIKLFVGQVPKTFEEKDLRPYLEPYGPIHELSILRDKLTKIHKGGTVCDEV